MYIAVKNMTDLKMPQPCHGKSLARLARECFTSHQALIVDFDGVGAISQGFLQELFLPLVAEYGADFLRSELQVINVSPDIDKAMKAAFNANALNHFLGQRENQLNQASDAEIYDLNLAWLIKARELARENGMLAELMMGIGDEALRLAISQLSINDIQQLAQAGWLCFAPRFTANFLQDLLTRPHDVVDVLLGLSGPH
ncbi:STAS-like domain-containing protein [Methylovulum miyakonense]|uniref:STAS-like domain-containing protein n=1 Tax=Methylovulum miyakonense TaxID=645578 RepID=UPI000368D6BB|nr:DUF4325 domain-containing protein [Methylovulum miyakonense]